MNGDQPARYAPISPGGAVDAVVLDPLVVLYHPASGQTHVVADPVPALIEALNAQSDALSVHDLAERIGWQAQRDQDDEVILRHHLDALAAIGLIERLPVPARDAP